MKLEKSIKSWGTNDFEDRLIDELTENQDELPLENFCKEGGWPDPDSISIEIDNISDDNKFIYIEFSASFDEVIPTSCSDIDMSEDAFCRFKYKINKGTAEAKLLDHQ